MERTRYIVGTQGKRVLVLPKLESPMQCTLKYIEQLAKRDLLYSTEYSQYSVIIYGGKESERMHMCMCMTGLRCCAVEIITVLKSNYTQ